MKRFPQYLLLSFIFFSISFAGTDKSNFRFERISVAQGLSHSTVNAVFQDSRGFLWFGTTSGLNKYDGYGIKTFKFGKENENGNLIVSIYESPTKPGTLWIGTQNSGMIKYDMQTGDFTKFEADKKINSLKSNTVNDFLEDKDKNFWIATWSGGLYQFDFKNNSFIKIDTSNYQNANQRIKFVQCIHEDSDGKLWFGTGSGLSMLDKDKNEFKHFSIDKKDPDNFFKNSIRTIFENEDGNLWLGMAGNGLIKFDRKSKSMKRFLIDEDKSKYYTHNDIFAIYKDSKENFWIGTDGGGLYKFNETENTFTPFLNDPGNLYSISSNYIRTLYEDNSGLLWIGTWGGGVNKLNYNKGIFNNIQNIPGEKNSLTHNRILSVEEDSKRRIWIGTDGEGVDIYDPQKRKFRNIRSIKNRNSISNNYVISSCEDKQGNIWLGTWNDRINRYNPKTGRYKHYGLEKGNSRISNNTFAKAMLCDSKGQVWIGTLGNGAYKFNNKIDEFEKVQINNGNSPNNNISIGKIVEDKNGNICFSTFNDGLIIYSPDQDKFHFYNENPDSNELSYNRIFSFIQDEKGIFWIGTLGRGLDRLEFTDGDLNKPVFTNYCIEEGLPSNTVLGIADDKKGNLWISTNQGIVKFDKETKNIKKFRSRDALLNTEFTYGAALVARSGKIYFGGVNGLIELDPSTFHENNFVPPVVFTDFKLFNKEVEIGGDSPLKSLINEAEVIDLAHDQNVFSIEFSSLDYETPSNNKYSYKLEGFDKEWINADATRRYAAYTSLPGGEYEFKVKGTNSDGKWSKKTASVKIIVHPPFWKTAWFIILSLAIISGTVMILFKRHVKNERVKAELNAAHFAQMSIMPQEAPKLDNLDIAGICIPANEVGGDFYDYFWFDEDKTKFGIVLGDISGKAMSSAMTAVMTNGMIYSKARKGESIGRILSDLNRPVFEKTNKRMFAAVCLSSFDVKNKKMTFCNAGLVEPIIISNGEVNSIVGNAPRHPLGLIKECEYKETAIEVNQGDTIIFLTDGVTESQDSLRNFYGYNRLISLLENKDLSNMPAEAIRDMIIKDVNNFAGSTIYKDDIALVVVRIKELAD